MNGVNGAIGWCGGKKFIIAILGVIAVVITARTGIDVPQETINKVVEAIGMIVGGFTVGQGMADGLSGGKTSTVAATPTATNSGDVG